MSGRVVCRTGFTGRHVSRFDGRVAFCFGATQAETLGSKWMSAMRDPEWNKVGNTYASARAADVWMKDGVAVAFPKPIH